MEKTDCRYFNAEDSNCLHFTYPGEYDPCTDGDFKHCCESYPHFFGDKIVPRRFKTKEYGDSEFVFLTDDGHTIGKIHRDSVSIVDRMNDLNGWAQGMQKKNNRLSVEMSAIKREFRERGILTEAEFLELIE